MYPHTMQPPEASPEDVVVDVDTLCDAFDRSGALVMYLNTTLSEADAQAMFDSHQLVSEFDSVRGVSAVRHATDDEIEQAQQAAAQVVPPKTSSKTASSTT
jgi:hypothetical protein